MKAPLESNNDLSRSGSQKCRSYLRSYMKSFVDVERKRLVTAYSVDS